MREKVCQAITGASAQRIAYSYRANNPELQRAKFMSDGFCIFEGRDASGGTIRVIIEYPREKA